MKKQLFVLALSILSIAGAYAQNWSAILSDVNGLPGTLTSGIDGERYNFVSPKYNLDTPTQTIRLTVLDTENHEQPNGNNYCFSLSELAVYDGNGNKVSYTASSNADHNSLYWVSDGQGLPALSDGDYNTYFHSMWQSYNAVADYHYVELSLSTPVSEFSLEWDTRMDESKNSPTKVAVTLGTEYIPLGSEFQLGSAVTTADGLEKSGKLFVIKNNRVASFTTSNGIYYSGSGPQYITCAEKGTTDATFSNVVQLLPVDDGKYIVYWPEASLFLAKSGVDYNGKNGWQYSTNDINNAAKIIFIPLASGDFEMCYIDDYSVITTQNDSEIKTYVTDTLYVGADMRDNAMSCSKTFAPDKKEALDNGDYSQGFSLPIAFNWSIYEAQLSDETVASISITLSHFAYLNLSVTVTEAENYLTQYGDFDGICPADIITELNDKIIAARALIAEGTATDAQINATEADVRAALINYVSCKLGYYENLVDSLLANVEFSSYPYAAETYPVNSRAILESIKSSVVDAKSKADVYEASQYLTFYSQYDDELSRFYATKIIYNTLPITYGAAAGLPGSVQSYGGYVWSTNTLNLQEAVEGVRITFLANDDTEQLHEGYPIVALGEVELYDGAGNRVLLDEGAFSTNSQELSEGPMSDICDGSYSTFWHSIWKDGTMQPVGNVYLDVKFPAAMQSFSLTLYGRDNAALSPTEISLSKISNEQNDNVTVEGEIVYVYLSDGGVDAYATKDLDNGYYIEGENLCMPIKDYEVIYYTAQEYDSISTVAPALPEFTSFKFNNKFNPNLNVDAEAAAINKNIYFSLNAIGKWLTPSFKLSDDRAVAYVGDKLQESKVTRRSFATPQTYTVTYPGYNKIQYVETVISDGTDAIITPITLTADMLSTNKPSTESAESVASLLDGFPYTIFHSTWGSANNATIDVDTYIEFNLPESVENIRLYYQCRPQSGYNPLVLEIYVSEDGDAWSLAHTLNYNSDNMPVGGAGQTYTSPTISLGGSYSHLRVLQTEGEYSKNHMALAEMRLYKVEYTNVEIERELKRVPFGNNYTIDVEWLADKATSVPRIDIDIEDGLTVTSKNYYLNANFRITGYGMYDNFEDSVQIKGRGNTSWAYSKKPYRLKFADKVKPFGLTKGKSWVLLANAQSSSMMANAVAMKIGQLAGAEFVNHIIPVDLYMNGVYKGSYMFTEHVSMANNSVDVDESLGYLLELDSYYDEDYKFKSTYYSMPVNIKEPDLTEYTTEAAAARKKLIMDDYNALDSAVYWGTSLDNILDYDAYATFLLTNELVNNQEICHPKSTFLFKEELENPNSKIKFGPLWDFDWAFGYETTKNYCTSDYTASVYNTSMYDEPGYQMFNILIYDKTVQKYYYKAWNRFVENNSIDELMDFIDEYYTFANPSFVNNYNVWRDGLNYYNVKENMKQWISNRAEYLYSRLNKYDLDEFFFPLACDVDKSNNLTVRDVAITTAYLSGNTHSAFTFSKADTDNDGVISTTDIAAIEEAVAYADPLTALDYYNTTLAIGELYLNNFELVINEDYILPLHLNCYTDEGYKAMQFDVTVPDGVMILDAVAGPTLAGHKVTLAQRSMTTYRIVIYSNDDTMFNADSEDIVVNLTLNSYAVVPEEARVISVSNALAVDEATDALRLNDVAATFGVSTNIYDVTAPTASAIGGDGYITIAALAAQRVYVYGVDGRVVRSLNVAAGTTRVELPSGIYMVLGSKVVVR